MSIPRQLLTYLNSGKCFALIGSGLSNALEYPSWWQLATNAIDLLPPSDAERKELTELLTDEDYPEVFERIAARVGGVAPMLAELQGTFLPKRTSGPAYEIICKWPFRCFLTTNYDDEIQNHLQRVHQYFTPLTNSQVDLALINSNTQRRIVKLHGDLKSPDNIVLTTRQYTEFETGGIRQYFRNKLVSVFQMVPVVVIGHSMKDRDFQLILRLAKESSSPDNPIYMIVANASKAESEKFLREFNIRLLSFPNEDGTFKNLIQLLRQIDRFVVPRTANQGTPLDFPDVRDAERAVSLYVHSTLGVAGNNKIVHQILEPQILSLAASRASGVSIKDLGLLVKPDNLRNLPSFTAEIATALARMKQAGKVSTDGASVKATPKGNEHLAETERRRSIEEDQFFGAIKVSLSKHGSASDVETLITGLKTALVTVFQKRGLATAELLFRSNPFEPADMRELFEAVFPPATAVDDFGLRAEYCDAVMDVLTNPNEDQKKYLAHLSQGFFAYHMLGLDPAGQEVRKRLVQGTIWLLDSNILMPLVAQQSNQHRFINELLTRLQGLGIRPVTTPKLVSEVDRALSWMQHQLRNVLDGHERQALLEVTRRLDYSGNPFIDGFIEGNVAGKWRTMSEFLNSIGYVGKTSLRESIESHGIEIVNPASFDQTVESEVESISKEILKTREKGGTVRGDGDVQATAEAEVLHILRCVRANGLYSDKSVRRAFFVSTSRLLDFLYQKTDGLITWYPETLLNHLAYISGNPIDAELVFRGITSSFYSAGISVVDESAYRHYFKPAISEANATLNREIDNYVKAVANTVVEQQAERESILETFRFTPAIERPLFVEQMGWKAARVAEERFNDLRDSGKRQNGNG